MNNKDMPANPTLRSPSRHGQLQQTGTFGLTKREYFAGLAMQGIASRSDNQGNPLYEVEVTASISVQMAEQLLKALEESNNENV